jgi:outer membrane protein, heavy metal efflux system
MMYNIKKLLIIFLFFPFQVFSQQTPVLSLDEILHRIDQNNVLLQSYELKAESYRFKADAATAWMAPMVGVGTFMTPYPGQKVLDDRDYGSLMLRLEQDIPNRAKLNAKRRYIESQGDVEKAGREISLNGFKAQARRLYYSWLVAAQRIKVLQQNERIMQTMKKIEEVRYPYNQSQLGSVFKADAKIEDNRNMIRMQEGEISKARAYLNSLMNQPGNTPFAIDTSFQPRFYPAANYDTSALAAARKDIFQMNESIRSMELNIEAMKQEKKPDFKIQFDHMNPGSGLIAKQINPMGGMMPKSYSIMGMISIPIVPWASKMYKSEIKAMHFDIQAMKKERTGMLQESQGMLYGMQREIQTMEQRIQSMEEKVIPSLQKTMDAYFQNYQENKLQLYVVIDAWEALTMMQVNVLDEKLKLYQMIVDYEKELYR